VTANAEKEVANAQAAGGFDVTLSNLTAIDDPMPCYPLSMRGSDEAVGNATSVLIAQICDH